MERFGHPDVIWCGTDCFTEGHLVWTTNGYKDIKDVKCFDYVLTHTGEYKRVNAKFEKMDYQFYKIKISGCEEMLVTQNHPFLARKKKRINTHLNGEPLTYAKMLEPEWVSAKELTSEYRVGIRINNESKIPEWQGTTKAQANYKITPKEEIVCNYSKYMDNEDFWWFVGRYFGDGTLENKCGVGICCNKNEQHENEEIRNVLDKLDVKYYFYEKTTANHFYVFDKELYDFLMQFGKGALNKTITPTILDLPINLLKKFIDGYHSADGDIHYNGAGNEEWGFTTISKGLAYGIQQCMLKAYGVYGNITTRDNTDVIQGRKVNAHKAYTVRFLINRNENRKFYEIENGIAWVNVRKVEKQLFTNENKRVVYNMSVEDDESYTVNNIIVHNCTSYSVAAISKHRRKNPETGNLDPISDYAKFCDNMNIHVKELIKELNPELYFWENPRAGLRKMTFMQDIPRYTITYCQYMQNEPWEKRRMKPTDVWTNHPDPKFKPPCKNGSPCHPPAPRGSNKYGTQALKGTLERSMYPKELCEHIVDICEDYMNEKNLYDKCKSCDNKWSSSECEMCEDFDMYKNKAENK